MVFEDGSEIIFYEGNPSSEARERYKRISDALNAGWLDRLYEELPSTIETVSLADETVMLINQIVDSITSEVGRAVAGLTILQLIIKCLEPSQSIRLHKAGTGGFSWSEGVSMRQLDTRFVTPFLRKYDLLRINRDGLFMTRSLAENYPYSQFYKAAVRGAKQAWLDLIDRVEANVAESCDALKYLLAQLRNRAKRFQNRAEHAIEVTKSWLSRKPEPERIQQLILKHIEGSQYSARLLEIGMHSFLQALEDREVLHGRLVPLCQMRTANKKHRNIADIEIVSEGGSVLEAWDAKYGKPYLQDELYELAEKLEGKTPEVVGFVVNQDPDLRQDIRDTIEFMKEESGVDIRIFALVDWPDFQVKRTSIEQHYEAIIQEWATAYVETLCQRRRNRAPVDEPADQWVEDWIRLIEEELQA